MQQSYVISGRDGNDTSWLQRGKSSTSTGKSTSHSILQCTLYFFGFILSAGDTCHFPAHNTSPDGSEAGEPVGNVTADRSALPSPSG